MFTRIRIFIFLALTCTGLATTAHAQQAEASHSARDAGPRLDRTATAVRQLTTADSSSTVNAAAKRQNMGQPVALMVVGGAAIILGAVIGGDAGTLFMIGGAVAGLFGLYQYLQ
jgi:hypothetical protein